MTTDINLPIDTLVHDIKYLSLATEHGKHSHHNYYYMDNCSDATVTATKDTRFLKNQPQCQKNHPRKNNKTSHSFSRNNNNSGYNINSLENHDDIFQSFTEPPIETKKASRFSFIKKVKKVFRLQNKKKQPSLPVLSTMEQWNPSIDSLSSSATIVKPDQQSLHSSQSSFTQDRSIFRHSCGIAASPLFHKKRSRGILKQPPTTAGRPTSLILKENKKRWSNARLSVYEHTPTKKRYTALSMMNPPPKRKQHTQGVRFNKYVRIHETYSKTDYDRSSDTDAICNRLTPDIAKEIKQELNEYKRNEMVVHEHSRIHNHIFI